MLKAARRKIKEIEEKYLEERKTKGESYSFNMFSQDIQTYHTPLTHIVIQLQDFKQALHNITPSVSTEELLKYQQLK